MSCLLLCAASVLTILLDALLLARHADSAALPGDIVFLTGMLVLAVLTTVYYRRNKCALEAAQQKGEGSQDPHAGW